MKTYPYASGASRIRKALLARLSVLFTALFLFGSFVQADFATWIASNVPAIPVDQQGEGDDPDGDGIPNIVEYLIDGMNPGISDADKMPAAQVSGTTFTYTVPKRAGIDGVNAIVQVYDVNGSTWTTATNVTEDASSIVLAETVGSTALLARLLVTTGVAPSSNPIAVAYPVEYGNGEYAWTDSINWDNVFNVLDYGAVADGDPAFVSPTDIVLAGISTDPLRPDYVIPAGFPHSAGTCNLAAFTAAIAAANAAGGGVVFVPAGTYYISNHLYTKDGVVIMGEKPESGQDNALLASFNPPSKLLFPRYVPNPDANPDPESAPQNPKPSRGNPTHGGDGVGFKRIFTEDPYTDSNQGFVWLDINRAAIILDTPSRMPLTTGGNWSGKPAGLLELLRGVNRVVFGMRSNNAGLAEGSDGANSGVPAAWQDPWQRWTYRFNANVRIGGGGYTLIANCRINDLSAQNDFRWGNPSETGTPTYVDDSWDQPNYKVRGATGTTVYTLNHRPGQAAFLHSNQYSLSINGLFYFAKAGHTAEGGVADPDGNPASHYGTPTSAPNLFHPGNVVRDNWIFGTLGAKMEISGQGMKVLNNVMEDLSNKWAFVMSTGLTQPTGSSFMSRGMLFGGYDVVVDGNTIRTYKHRIGNVQTGGDGGYYVNDGEGVMIDNTTTRVNGLTITNNVSSASIFAYRTRETRNVLIAGNTFQNVAASSNTGGILIIANDAGSTNYGVQNILIENNSNRDGHNIRIAASEFLNRNFYEGDDPIPSSNVIIRDNIAPADTRTITFPGVIEPIITLENNVNFTINNAGSQS